MSSQNGAFRFREVIITLIDNRASLKQAIQRFKRKLPLVDVAVPATTYGVWVIIRKSLIFLAGIEAEHAIFVALQSGLAEAHGPVVRRDGIFRLEYLNYSAAAVRRTERMRS